MEPFPKQKLATLKLIDVKKVDIDLFCCCSVPEVKGLGPGIACDTCDKWYLQKCEGVKGSRIAKNIPYKCRKCQVTHSQANQNKSQTEKDKKVKKIIMEQKNNRQLNLVEN